MRPFQAVVKSGSASLTSPERSPSAAWAGSRQALKFVACGLGAVAAFHLAYLTSARWLIALFPVALLPLARVPTPRLAFYGGLLIGYGIYAPHLAFFWRIFGPAALILWGVLAFWLAFFLVLARDMCRRLGPRWLILLLPIAWTGLEYFRSELYYLKFTWLTPGYAAGPEAAPLMLRTLGVYGTGTLLFLGGALLVFGSRLAKALGVAFLVLPFIGSPSQAPGETATRLTVAGAQVESVPESQLPGVLNRLIAEYPSTELVVLPEYTVDREPNAELREWCRRNRRHLIVGGREVLPDGEFYDTAWVVDSAGEIVFRQAKSVPIQFFHDGLPARVQELWNSPWGPIGLAICYDLSYRRVVDRLVRAGAVALIVPTSDLYSWGEYQHRLHARVAPVRAAEYGIPIVRSAGSGISQVVDRTGRVMASAPAAEDLQLFSGTIELDGPGFLPADRWVAPGAAVFVGAWLFSLLLLECRKKFHRKNRVSESLIQG